MWNVRKLFRFCSLIGAARELARYKLDLVGVEDVRWDKGVTARARDYNFFMEKETKFINWGQDFCTPQIVSTIKGVEFVAIGYHIKF